jgi:hypothetical protein
MGNTPRMVKLRLANGDEYDGHTRTTDDGRVLMHGQGRVTVGPCPRLFSDRGRYWYNDEKWNQTTGPRLYHGQWNNGQKHGTGEMVYRDNVRYAGPWHHDTRQGDGAVWRKPDHWTYEGSFLNDKPHGQGVLKVLPADKIVYDGQWVSGSRTGHRPQSDPIVPWLNQVY